MTTREEQQSDQSKGEYNIKYGGYITVYIIEMVTHLPRRTVNLDTSLSTPRAVHVERKGVEQVQHETTFWVCGVKSGAYMVSIDYII